MEDTKINVITESQIDNLISVLSHTPDNSLLELIIASCISAIVACLISIFYNSQVEKRRFIKSEKEKLFDHLKQLDCSVRSLLEKKVELDLKSIERIMLDLQAEFQLLEIVKQEIYKSSKVLKKKSKDLREAYDEKQVELYELITGSEISDLLKECNHTAVIHFKRQYNKAIRSVTTKLYSL